MPEYIQYTSNVSSQIYIYIPHTTKYTRIESAFMQKIKVLRFTTEYAELAYMQYVENI